MKPSYEQPVYPPCGNLYPVPCWCGSCAVETDRIDVAFYGAEAAARAEEARLRTYLKDCDCRCCEAHARLAVLSYEIAFYPVTEASDRRDDNEDARLAADAAAAEKDYRSESEVVYPANEVPPQS